MPCNLSQKNNIITQCNEKKNSELCLPVTFSKSFNLGVNFCYIVVIIYLNVLCKNVKEFPTIKDPFTFRGPLLAGQGNYFISNLIMWSRYVTRIDHYMKWTYNLSEFRPHISA